MTWKITLNETHPEIEVMIRDYHALKSCCLYWKDRINNEHSKEKIDFAKKLYKARNEERRILKAQISDLVTEAKFEAHFE